MLISDWSSDVCASDLYFAADADARIKIAAGLQRSAVAGDQDIGRAILGVGIGIFALDAEHGAVQVDVIADHAAIEQAAVMGAGIEIGETGGESCRERVCQYV